MTLAVFVLLPDESLEQGRNRWRMLTCAIPVMLWSLTCLLTNVVFSLSLHRCSFPPGGVISPVLLWSPWWFYVLFKICSRLQLLRKSNASKFASYFFYQSASAFKKLTTSTSLPWSPECRKWRTQLIDKYRGGVEDTRLKAKEKKNPRSRTAFLRPRPRTQPQVF